MRAEAEVSVDIPLLNVGFYSLSPVYCQNDVLLRRRHVCVCLAALRNILRIGPLTSEGASPLTSEGAMFKSR